MTRDLKTPPNKVWSHRKIAKTQKEHKDAVDLRQGNNPNKEKTGNLLKSQGAGRGQNRRQRPKTGRNQAGRSQAGRLQGLLN